MNLSWQGLTVMLLISIIHSLKLETLFFLWNYIPASHYMQGRVTFDENGTIFQDRIRLLQYRRQSNGKNESKWDNPHIIIIYINPLNVPQGLSERGLDMLTEILSLYSLMREGKMTSLYSQVSWLCSQTLSLTYPFQCFWHHNNFCFPKRTLIQS